MSIYLNSVIFGWYPYVCCTVFLLGSLLRFDASQYTWRTGSSQLLRRRQLGLGFQSFSCRYTYHLRRPYRRVADTGGNFYALGISHTFKQLLAISVGGVAGIACFVGTTMLVHRRLFDPRIRKTSSAGDIVHPPDALSPAHLGLVYHCGIRAASGRHRDGQVHGMGQGIVMLHPAVAILILDVNPIFKLHLFLGMTIFLVFPFTRLVHVWSAPVGISAEPAFRSYVQSSR